MDTGSIWQWFVAPLQYEFMVKAIVSALLGLSVQFCPAT